MFHKKYWLVIFVVLFAACQSETHRNSRNKDSSQERIKQQDQPKKQNTNTGKLAATFRLNMDDAVTNNDFIVNVYPENKTSQYKLVIQYGGNYAQDVVDFPPEKFIQKIELRKGNTNSECILGFIDNNGDFREMKLISCTTTQIKIKSLKAYYFTTKQK